MSNPQPQASQPQSKATQSSQCPIPASPMASAPPTTAPSAVPSPAVGSPRPTPSTPFLSHVSTSDRNLSINPNRNPSASGCSTGNPDLPTTATESAAAGTATSNGPTKIPFRPRKTRKLAATCSPAKQETDDKVEPGAASQEGNDDAVVVAGPVVIHNHPRTVYRVPPRPLSAQGEVAAAISHLRSADPQLAQVIDAHDPPVFQSLHPPFHSLTRSILYQQLAFKAAASIYSRFLALCGGEDGVVPEVVLGLGAHQLRQIGVSARKASYLHDLANKYRNGILSDSSIVAMDDKSLFTMLNMVKGIGAWSVHMFMIFSLHRPDVLPVGDVGVRKGVQILCGLDTLPRPSQMEQLCERWKPYRSVGSWYMWRLVEAKGMPAALATVSSGAAVMVAANGGSIEASQIVGVPSALPPHLRQQMPQQHQHLHPPQNLHPHQHQHQQQHQHQLQMQSQLVDGYIKQRRL